MFAKQFIIRKYRKIFHLRLEENEKDKESAMGGESSAEDELDELKD